MAFVTGLMLIDAPAAALNNLGNIPGEREQNTVGVKVIKSGGSIYPYVSAQAFRYWLRTTLERGDFGWRAAPVYREAKVAYTDANPLDYWDDDLFGYMRAPSTKAAAKEKRAADTNRSNETPTTDTVTRVSPFRVGTLVSIAPVTLTTDFGVMTRQEGYPAPFEHQFYRATLQGLWSLDLNASGTFSYRQRSGFLNLDAERVNRAQAQGLEHLSDAKSYRLSQEERVKRVKALFEGLARLEGGAKQSLHYTDVAPDLVLMAVTRGGNHIFGHVIGTNGREGQPMIKHEALAEALRVFQDDILSDIYVGWTRGYLDEERKRFEDAISKGAFGDQRIHISHPREAFLAMSEALAENAEWLA